MVEIIITVALEVAKCLAPPTERQISYLRNYKSNSENLRTEIEKLKHDSGSIQHAADEAKRKGEEIEKNVEKWLESVNKVIVETEKFVGGDEAIANKRCFKGLCPNLKTRLQFSKEAVRQLEAIVKLREAGRFDRISYRSIPEDILLISNKDYEAFESRMSTLKNILGALNNPDVNMLGIYGMGGIGKTTLAKEVARKAEIDKLFDKVVFAEVSPSPDIRKIQGEIADKLDLTFFEESESGRARRLCDRLKKEKKILLVLDNIWENLDLQAVGIPHGDDHKGCKILLTARSEDTLSRKMDCQQNFSVGILKEKEAWNLFKKMAGDYIEGNEFKSVAANVAKECAGLPVSIVTVARALRNKRLFEWKDALEQLRRPSSMNFKDIQPTAYKAIELSYNKLEGEELKNIFLLIGYTYMASIDNLLMYGMGLGLFQGINKMEEARARVSTLVYKLKASCLLLDEDLSMHDVVRDVAISIASREQNVFMVINDQLVDLWEWSDESSVKLYTSIVLRDVKTDDVLPEVLECPQLKLLYIHAAEQSLLLTIPDNLFTRLIQIRVLDLTYMHLSSLPALSLGLLSNLRTMCLHYCKLQDISIIGDLKKLEILCLFGSDIKQLPVQVGQLTRLKLLDLRNCIFLEVIPPNVLSKFSRLEELYIGGESFNKWEVEVEGVKNASLDELKHLHNLTSLELQIKDVNTLPRGLFFEKLETYKILIGDNWYWQDIHTSSKSCSEFRLKLNTNIYLKDGLIVQLQGIEELYLFGLQEQDIKNFVNELVKVGASQLKHLFVQGCTAPNPTDSKLTTLCFILETLSMSEHRRDDLTIDMLSNEIILEDDVSVFNTLFNYKVAIPQLETLYLSSIDVERIWQNQVVAISCGIQNLTHLTIYNCRNLRCLLLSCIVSSFVRLQHLEIRKCPVLEELIVMDQEESKNNIVMFPRLQYLYMEDLEKLRSFCTGDLLIEFQSLKELRIIRCPVFMVKHKSTTHDLTEKVFPNLKDLRVDAKHVATKCQFPRDFLCKLNRLEVEFDESNTISSLDFLQRFHTIKVLQIGGEVFVGVSNEMIENGMKALMRGVNNCCDLKHILRQESSNLENLVILNVRWCHNLINLVSSPAPFRNLTTLTVQSCNGLINVFTSSTAKSLVRLRQMSIGECEMIKEIVADNDAAKDEIVFSELKELELFALESLTSFCSGNCAFKFPSFETLVVENCPDIKIFCQGESSTPKLHKILRDKRTAKYWTWKGDLNTTIREREHTEEEDKEENDTSTEEDDEEEDAEGSESPNI